MSRTGLFYVVKAMERAATGTTEASRPPVPPRRSDGHDMPEALRARGAGLSRWQRLSAAVRHGSGGAPRYIGWGRRRLGRAARAD
jgi:hypothetical protein